VDNDTRDIQTVAEQHPLMKRFHFSTTTLLRRMVSGFNQLQNGVKGPNIPGILFGIESRPVLKFLISY